MSEHKEDGSVPLAGNDRQHSDEHAERHLRFTEQNREHWNKSAATYSSKPWHKDLINKTHEFLLAHLSWLGVDFLDPSTAFEEDSATHHHQVRVLDYACGPGTITAILAAHATEFVGIDLSDNMVQAYNERFGSATDTDPQGGPQPPRTQTQTLNAHAVVGDLVSPTTTITTPPGGDYSTLFSTPQYHAFDLVVVGFGFHHFADLRLATDRLVARLRPGGVLLIVDFVSHPPVEAPAEAPAMPKAEQAGAGAGAGAGADEEPTPATAEPAGHVHGDGHGVAHGDGDGDGHGHVHAGQHTIAHHGFKAEDVHRYFGGAGLVDIDVLRVPGEIKMVFDAGGSGEGEGGHGHGHGRGKEHVVSRTIFLAKGRKPNVLPGARDTE